MVSRPDPLVVLNTDMHLRQARLTALYPSASPPSNCKSTPNTRLSTSRNSASATRRRCRRPRANSASSHPALTRLRCATLPRWWRCAMLCLVSLTLPRLPLPQTRKRLVWTDLCQMAFPTSSRGRSNFALLFPSLLWGSLYVHLVFSLSHWHKLIFTAGDPFSQSAWQVIDFQHGGYNMARYTLILRRDHIELKASSAYSMIQKKLACFNRDISREESIIYLYLLFGNLMRYMLWMKSI